MAHGGKREGAGRPKGSTTKRTREIVDRHEAKPGALMPLDVMLGAMQRHVEADQWDEAAKIAKDAAPYTHPKLAAIEHSGPDQGPVELKQYTDLDKAKAIAALFARVKAENSL